MHELDDCIVIHMTIEPFNPEELLEQVHEIEDTEARAQALAALKQTYPWLPIAAPKSGESYVSSDEGDMTNVIELWDSKAGKEYVYTHGRSALAPELGALATVTYFTPMSSRQ